MSHPVNRRERFLIGEHLGKRRGYGYWGGCKFLGDPEEREKALQLASQKRRNTTKLCSCAMCGNPRHKNPKDKLTMQEKKFNGSMGL